MNPDTILFITFIITSGIFILLLLLVFFYRVSQDLFPNGLPCVKTRNHPEHVEV